MRKLVIGVIVLGLLAGGPGRDRAVPAAAQAEIPHYFVAIHNEPYHGSPDGRARIAQDWERLVRMVAQADAYGIRLTLMFPPQWAGYILDSPERQALLADWEAAGHEIAAHHHSIYHGSWDGYSSYAPAIIEEERASRTDRQEPYLGALDDFTGVLRQLNPDMRAGCLNDEQDKHTLPDAFVIDTCGGLANFGAVGTPLGDGAADKGINQYVTVGVYRGIERRWLAHASVGTLAHQRAAQDAFRSMAAGGVYGSISHSTAQAADAFAAWLAFLHGVDPEAAYSRTLSEVIAEGLLPEEHLDEAFQPGHPCGDLTCDVREQVDPTLCPADCVDAPEAVTSDGGEPFRLDVGQTGVLPAFDLAIQFQAVIGDSRCPADVLCVWAGQVTVRLALVHADDLPEPVEVTGFPDPDHSLIVAWTPFRVEVLEVGPYPGSEAAAAGETPYVILRAGPLTE